MNMHSPMRNRSAGRSWIRWVVFLGFATLAGYLLTTEHRTHVLIALPWLLILSCCALMMLFMSHTATGNADKK